MIDTAAEKQFENKIKKYLEDQGCWYVKYFANSFTKSGIPDLLICCNGYFLSVEVKASNGKPSELQVHHRDMIRKSGGISIILYPDQFEEFKDLILLLKTIKSHSSELRQYEFDRR